MYGSLDISTSGMIAQRTRLEVISANIANSSAILNAAGEYEPYRRRVAYLSSGDPSASDPSGRAMGAHVKQIGLDDAPLVPRYQPGSKYADERGYVMYPNVNSANERVDALEAVRAYEANVAAVEASKDMFDQALTLLA
ncbi:MAG: flagellar basal body rod protein FlgC [Planctomycetota bacterium]